MATQTRNAEEIVRAFYAAYRARDRARFEQLMAADFAFVSPYDDHIDRATYFARCWAPGDKQREFRIEQIALAGSDSVYLTYKVEVDGGKAFRNTELLRLRDGKVSQVHVFFGETYRDGKFAAQSPG
jgi:ketosteroid isomerase-like protein